MPPSPVLAADVPLVGRDLELADLVERISTDDRASYLIAGPAGVGKTRLVSEVARRTSGPERGSLHLTATKASSDIPFGVFARFLQIGPGADSQAALIRQAAAAITERLGDRPGLILIDDAHHLDQCSSALVHDLVREGSCAVLASLRSQTAAPDSVVALWKDGLATRMDLDPLPEDKVAELAAQLLGSPMTGAGTRWIWEVTKGNPLHVRELLIAATESGMLREAAGVWTLREPVPATPRLADVIGARFGDMPGPTREVAEVVALAEPIGLQIVEDVCPPAAVEDAEQQGLIVVIEEDGRSQASLWHPLYGDVLRQQMPQTRRRRLSARLADALGSAGARRAGDLVKLAMLDLESGRATDPSMLGQAAERARLAFDLPLATRLARAALRSGGGWKASMALAEVEAINGNHDEAEAILAQLAGTPGTDEEHTAAAVLRAYNLGERMGDPAAADAVLDAVLEVITDPACRNQILFRRAQSMLLSGDVADAVAAGRELLVGDPRLVPQAAYVVSIGLALLGRSQDALEIAERGEEALRASANERNWNDATLTGSTLAHLAAGNLADAFEAAQRGYRIAVDHHDEESQATYAFLVGLVLTEQGRLAEGAARFREGLAVADSTGNSGIRRWCAGGLALGEGLAAHPEAAAEAARRLDSEVTGWIAVLDADVVERGRAWALAAAGELSAALQVLQTASAWAADRRMAVSEARLLHDILRLDHRRPVARRLAELATEADGTLVPALAQHAAAVATGTGAALQSAADAFEAMGFLQLAAEATAEAATAYRGEGLDRLTSSMTRRSNRLYDRCGSIAPAAVSSTHDQSGLTRREWEIATLAGHGNSSRLIAERLHISVRTVDTHLLRVYKKLGVTSREQLAAALSP